MRWRTISYARTPAATDAFRESISPFIGILAVKSQVSFTRRPTPSPSLPKRRAVGLTATVARTSAGALNYTPVAKVTNLVKTMEDLKKKGLWFVCADMDGDVMYDVNMKGPIGLVIGNEGEGVGRLVKDTCDFTARIPMKGDIDSLNASVAAGVLAYEIVRQRMQ